ncbi:MAG: flagellar biosynthetic protein FliO [Myxococcota bacterium]
MMHAAAVIVLALALAPAAACAADASTGAERLPAIDSFPSPMVAPLWRIGLILAGISATSGGLALWSRRRRLAIGGGDANIRVLANRSLTSRHQVFLVDVGGHRLLVGTGTNAIAVLADLTEKELFSRTLDRHVPAEQAPPDTDVLQSIGRFEGLDA